MRPGTCWRCDTFGMTEDLWEATRALELYAFSTAVERLASPPSGHT